MAVNRYYAGQPLPYESQFVPTQLPIDFLLKTGATKQASYDKQASQEEADKILKQQGLSSVSDLEKSYQIGDANRVKTIKDQITKEIDNFATSIGNTDKGSQTYQNAYKNYKTKTQGLINELDVYDKRRQDYETLDKTREKYTDYGTNPETGYYFNKGIRDFVQSGTALNQEYQPIKAFNEIDALNTEMNKIKDSGFGKEFLTADGYIRSEDYNGVGKAKIAEAAGNWWEANQAVQNNVALQYKDLLMRYGKDNIPDWETYRSQRKNNAIVQAQSIFERHTSRQELKGDPNYQFNQDNLKNAPFAPPTTISTPSNQNTLFESLLKGTTYYAEVQNNKIGALQKQIDEERLLPEGKRTMTEDQLNSLMKKRNDLVFSNDVYNRNRDAIVKEVAKDMKFDIEGLAKNNPQLAPLLNNIADLRTIFSLVAPGLAVLPQDREGFYEMYDKYGDIEISSGVTLGDLFKSTISNTIVTQANEDATNTIKTLVEPLVEFHNKVTTKMASNSLPTTFNVEARVISDEKNPAGKSVLSSINAAPGSFEFQDALGNTVPILPGSAISVAVGAGKDANGNPLIQVRTKGGLSLSDATTMADDQIKYAENNGSTYDSKEKTALRKSLINAYQKEGGVYTVKPSTLLHSAFNKQIFTAIDNVNTKDMSSADKTAFKFKTVNNFNVQSAEAELRTGKNNVTFEMDYSVLDPSLPKIQYQATKQGDKLIISPVEIYGGSYGNTEFTDYQTGVTSSQPNYAAGITSSGSYSNFSSLLDFQQAAIESFKAQ